VRWRNNVRLKRWDFEVIPKSDSVGFQSLGRGVVPARCMIRKTGTLLETSGNLC